MPNHIVVREAQVGDASAIAHVHVLSWQGAYRGLVPDEILDSLSVGRRGDSWRERLGTSDGKTWIAELSGGIVGFVTAGASRDEDAADDTGEVNAIYVLPHAWDKAVGAALMNTAVSWLRETFSAATLWVLKGNARGRRFYEKGGWCPDGSAQPLDFGGTSLDEVRYRIEL
jgi:GNAT superfamily N-acetyltransferase